MILDATTKSIRIFLGGAVTTNELQWTSSWADHDATAKLFTPADSQGVTSGATPVVVIAAPAASKQRQVKNLTIFNADTVNQTVTVEKLEVANRRKWIQAILEPNWSLQWEYGGTWHVYDENGILQTSLATAPAGSITIEEVDGAPTLVGITTLRFDQADGFVVSQPGANIARVDFSGGAATDLDARILAWMGL